MRRSLESRGQSGGQGWGQQLRGGGEGIPCPSAATRYRARVLHVNTCMYKWIHVPVYISVYVYVCMYFSLVCMHLYCVCVYVHLYVLLRVYTYLRVCVQVCVSTYVCVPVLSAPRQHDAQRAGLASGVGC